MKVLLIAKTMTKGGAASGARNLLSALRAAGAEVIPLDAYSLQQSSFKRLCRFMERGYERLLHDAETHCLRMGPPTFNLESLYYEHHPDVIQLCDVSANTIRFADMKKVPCPVVHRMSDFWPYHGARHYAERKLDSVDVADFLLRSLVFDGATMPDCRVAPSHWLADSLGGDDIIVIRNAVDIPLCASARSTHEGPVRFGFISGDIFDPRKGFELLPPFLNMTHRNGIGSIELHTFGKVSRKLAPDNFQFPVVQHPPFTSKELSKVYSTFDVLLCPSKRDNSPNVVSESLAHGVPVIAQSGTGMDSYIASDRGALVDFQNPCDISFGHFKDAIVNIVSCYQDFSGNALSYARRELSTAAVGSRYIALYESLMRCNL